jgi:four helix bundle protein
MQIETREIAAFGHLYLPTSNYPLPISQLPSTIFNMIMTFEDLESWQKARKNVRTIYELSRGEEMRRDFGICGQIQRAGVSVMSNIAEGFERVHLLEKCQFYNVARGSTAEVRSLLYVIEDNFPQSASGAATLRGEVVSAGKLISGLIQSTERRKVRS